MRRPKTSIVGKIVPETLPPPWEPMFNQKVHDSWIKAEPKKAKKKKDRIRICLKAIII